MTEHESREATEKVIRQMEEQFHDRRTIAERSRGESAPDLAHQWVYHVDALWRAREWHDPTGPGRIESDPHPEYAMLYDVDTPRRGYMPISPWRAVQTASFVLRSTDFLSRVSRDVADRAREVTERYSHWHERADDLSGADLFQRMASVFGEPGDKAEVERLRLDSDYVSRRLSLIFTARQARIWLESFNSGLGSRPIDVLWLRGASEVIRAIDAEEQGAYT